MGSSEKIINMVVSLKNIARDLKCVAEASEADGCEGCVYEDVNEWELPCCKCKRGCKDYWRKPQGK